MIAALLASALAVAAPVVRHPGLEPGSRLPAAEDKAAGPRAEPGVTNKETPDDVALRYGLAGEMLVAKGGHILLDRGYGTVDPNGGAKHKAGERWRLASITKQIVAAMILRNTDLAALDAPIQRPAALAASKLTLRQLLTHHSGLANPDDSAADADGVPVFYRTGSPDFAYCLSKPPTPGAPFAYNNCDYLLAPAAAPFTGSGSGFEFDKNSLSMAEPGERGVPGFVHGKPEPHFELTAWSYAGGAIGTARGLLQFDQGLMTGTMLPPAKLAELWKPEGNGSYQALGQWVFPGKLKGCAAPKRIVQRDGEIYGVQARNFILPDDGLVVIVFTNRSADDFPIGEVWQGKGFAYDLLSAAVAC